MSVCRTRAARHRTRDVEEEEKTIRVKKFIKNLCGCEFNQIHPYVVKRSIKISNNSISCVSVERAKLN